MKRSGVPASHGQLQAVNDESTIDDDEAYIPPSPRTPPTKAAPNAGRPSRSLPSQTTNVIQGVAKPHYGRVFPSQATRPLPTIPPIPKRPCITFNFQGFALAKICYLSKQLVIETNGRTVRWTLTFTGGSPVPCGSARVGWVQISSSPSHSSQTRHAPTGSPTIPRS
jgi:hypothetical protein